MHALQPALARRLLWAAALACGFIIVWMAGISVLTMFGGGEPQRDSRDVVIKRDGTPLIRTRVSRTNRVTQTTTYGDLEGRAVDVPNDDSQWVPETNVPSVAFLPDRIPTFLWRMNWDRRLRWFPGSVGTSWGFVHDGRLDGRGYFVGFDTETKARLGYIGREGFSSGMIPLQDQIPVQGLVMSSKTSNWNRSSKDRSANPAASGGQFPPWYVFIPSGSELLLADLQARTVRPLFSSPEAIEGVAINTEWHWQAATSTQSLLVRTANRLYVFDQHFKLERSFAVPADPQVTINYFKVDGRTTVITHRSPFPKEVETLYWMSPAGEIQKSQSVTFASAAHTNDPRIQAIISGFQIPAPLLSAFASFVGPFLEVTYGNATYSEAFGREFANAWPEAIVEFVIAFLCAAWTRRHMARYAVPTRERKAWLAFVILLGLPGLAGYLLHRRWPVRAECPVCHGASPRDRESCTACSAPFATAPLRGIEVFA